MTDLRDFLNKYGNVNLRRVIVSKARKKDGISKIQLRPRQIKNGIFYQVTRTLGPKEIHENYEKQISLEDISRYIGISESPVSYTHLGMGGARCQ